MDINKFKKLLLKRKEELLNSSKESSKDRKPVELDQQSIGRLSRMDAMQQQGVAITTEAQRQNELKKIESALLRIENDEYGVCIKCGEDIPEKRLEITPSAFLCVDCGSNS